MRRESHVRFGERPGETDPGQPGHRAPGRLSCEAPIQHADHIRPYTTGGPTELANAAGMCESCNYLKEAPGWHTTVVNDNRHIIEITTPSGHRYRSQPPPAPDNHDQADDHDHDHPNHDTGGAA